LSFTKATSKAASEPSMPAKAEAPTAPSPPADSPAADGEGDKEGHENAGPKDVLFF